MNHEIDLPPGLSPSQRVMHILRSLYRDFGLVWVLTVARTIVHELYQGRLDRYHDSSGHKTDGLAKLVEENAPELGDMRLNLPTLRAYVSAWEVHRDLPPDLQPALTATHLMHLSALPGTAERVAMARLAVDNAWATRTLKAEVEARLLELQGDAPRKGRPRLAPEVKIAGSAERDLAELEALIAAQGSLDDLPLGQKVLLRQRLEALDARTQRLLAQLRG